MKQAAAQQPPIATPIRNVSIVITYESMLKSLYSFAGAQKCRFCIYWQKSFCHSFRSLSPCGHACACCGEMIRKTPKRLTIAGRVDRRVCIGYAVWAMTLVRQRSAPSGFKQLSRLPHQQAVFLSTPPPCPALMKMGWDCQAWEEDMSDGTRAALQLIRDSMNEGRSDQDYRYYVSEALKLLCQEIERLEAELSALKPSS